MVVCTMYILYTMYILRKFVHIIQVNLVYERNSGTKLKFTISQHRSTSIYYWKPNIQPTGMNINAITSSPSSRNQMKNIAPTWSTGQFSPNSTGKKLCLWSIARVDPCRAEYLIIPLLLSRVNMAASNWNIGGLDFIYPLQVICVHICNLAEREEGGREIF